MKITKKYLQKLIKEEFGRVLQEDFVQPGSMVDAPDLPFDGKTDRIARAKQSQLEFECWLDCPGDEQGVCPNQEEWIADCIRKRGGTP